MAKQIITKLIDDLDGGLAAETVAFAYDGIEYTIDLSAKNATRFRKALRPYVENGTKTPARKPGRRGAPADHETVEGRARIRAWARRTMPDKFPDLSDRGRIPYEIVAAYHEAHRAGS